MPYDYDQDIERTTRFSHTYFHNCVSRIAWMCQCAQVQQLLSLKGSFLKLIRPPKRSTFNVYDLEGIKLLTQLHVEFSDLCYHKSYLFVPDRNLR